MLQWERLKAERDKEDLKDCTFAPAVNACAGPHTPLHRRLSELQRQRRCVHMPPATPYKLQLIAMQLTSVIMTTSSFSVCITVQAGKDVHQHIAGGCATLSIEHAKF